MCYNIGPRGAPSLAHMYQTRVEVTNALAYLDMTPKVDEMFHIFNFLLIYQKMVQYKVKT
jgi:hypothetical protein